MQDFMLRRCLIVICLLAMVVCNVVNASTSDDPLGNLDEFNGFADQTYNNALSLGVGIIVAIVIGIIAAVVLVIVLCVCCCYHCCCKNRQATHSTVVMTNTPMQQPVSYEPAGRGPNMEGAPPYPGQQASYGYVKL